MNVYILLWNVYAAKFYPIIIKYFFNLTFLTWNLLISM